MRWLRRALFTVWRAAGAGSVYTVIAWLVLLPFAVTILGGYDDAATPSDRAAGFGIALAVHAMIGIGMLGGAALERALRAPNARAIAVTAVAVALGLGRPLLIDHLQTTRHLHLYSGMLPVRMATNVAVLVAALAVTAIITTTVRHHARVQRDLHAIRSAFEAARADDDAWADRFAREFVSHARASVREGIALARPRHFDRELESEALRRVSESVVRPLSHAAFDASAIDQSAGPPVPAAADEAAPIGRGSSELWAELAGLKLVPAPAWAAPILYFSLLLPYAVTRLSLVAAILFTVLGVSAGTAASAALNRWPVSTRTFRASAAIHLLRAMVAGGAIAVSSLLVAWALGVALPAVVADVTVYPCLALAVTLALSVQRRLESAVGERTAAIREAERRAVDSHARLALQKEGLARLLHAGVQGELVATALRVSEGIDDRGEVDEALRRIDELLTWPLNAADPSPLAVKQNVDRILAAWGTTISIDFRAGTEVWDELSLNPAAAALMVDALSEALGNVIRHAAAAEVRIVIRRLDDEQGRGGAGLTMTARSPGRLPVQTGDERQQGYGLADLRRRAVDLSLAQSGENVELTVVVC